MSEAEPVNGLVARKALTASEPQASQHFDRKVTEEERLAGLRPTSTETKLYNPYAGEESARQLSETVSAFLSRLPPMTTSIADFGPWIWIANPYHQSRLTSQDWAGFMSTSENLMDDFQTQKAAVEKSMQGRPKGTITHKITPLRKILERQILDNAISKGCTAGKWMLFPRPDNVNRTWKLVAKGVANGELGMAAKVATDDGLNDGKGRLICVYTKDFSDLQDVKRVLIRLVELGLVKRKGPMGEERGVYYKCGKLMVGITRERLAYMFQMHTPIWASWVETSGVLNLAYILQTRSWRKERVGAWQMTADDH